MFYCSNIHKRSNEYDFYYWFSFTFLFVVTRFCVSVKKYKQIKRLAKKRNKNLRARALSHFPSLSDSHAFISILREKENAVFLSSFLISNAKF